ncbi:flavodoxin-dependent (E)-4-hydroxy-3-methylbut-2-enyl-diphosphate synthase [Nitriliruptor alkaliphilus]|uniref:flavodoxin-dependent (E)-4-hydroxy-3-methylbut-2-enyl-diphosphate synthase n=1 Tax=Nitriliruptor alkaliphilus TaxID=427918 RepID=UPI00069662AD
MPSTPAADAAPVVDGPFGPPGPTNPGRRRSRKIKVGPIEVGGDAPISVQTMTVTPTHEADTTLQAIAACQAAGADIVRVAVPRREDAEALAYLAEHSRIPLIADIHFQWKYAVLAIEAGCAAVRINPGNIKKHDKVALLGQLAGEADVAIRIGVNGGSLEDDILAKYGGRATPEAMVESALNEVRLLEDVGFGNTKISVKHSDPWVMIQTYRLLAASCDYPLHLGVTEAGPLKTGSIKSAVGIGALLAEGIGDTIRVSLSADPVEEVKAGIAILESLHLRERGLDVVSCPSCGRAQVDVWTLAEQVQKGLEGLDAPLRVAVMGCVVNGPGEAREADLGVAAGNGKGDIIKKGERIATVREEDIVEAMVHYATEMAEEIRAERGEGDPVVV